MKKCETQRGGENNTHIFHLARICMKKKKPICEKDVKNLIKQVTQHDRGRDEAGKDRRGSRPGLDILYSSDIFFIVVKYNKICHLNHFQSIQFSSMCNHHHRAAPEL